MDADDAHAIRNTLGLYPLSRGEKQYLAELEVALFESSEMLASIARNMELSGLPDEAAPIWNLLDKNYALQSASVSDVGKGKNFMKTSGVYHG
jgi:hypothetical protein